MQQKQSNPFRSLVIFATIAIALTLSACSSSGDSPGTTAGVGSSTVTGNVSSYTMASFEQNGSETRSIAAFFKFFLPVQTAYANTAVEGINVAIGAIGTVTNANGYFTLNGVPPGNHQIIFSKNNSVSYGSVAVGDNEVTTMHNVQMNGRQAHAQNVGHTPRSGHDNDRGNPGVPHT